MLSLEEVQALTVNLCVQFGFCLSPEAQERLAKEPPADADESPSRCSWPRGWIHRPPTESSTGV